MECKNFFDQNVDSVACAKARSEVTYVLKLVEWSQNPAETELDDVVLANNNILFLDQNSEDYYGIYQFIIYSGTSDSYLWEGCMTFEIRHRC